MSMDLWEESDGGVGGSRVFRSDSKRNRDAVVDALLGLYREGNLAPGSSEIAERAGISARSLFRYFDDVDDLARAAISSQQSRVIPLLAIDVAADAPRERRIEAVVQQRVALFDAIASVGLVSRMKAPFQPLVAAELTQSRAFLRRQLKRLFAPELNAMAAPRASLVLAAADVVCSFESYHLLRSDQMLSRTKTAAAIGEALTALLTTEEP
jgi:AcrR family transcriptional regulator